MYKFTSGIVVYDKETADKFLKAGHVLSTDKKLKCDKKTTNKKTDNEENNEDTFNDGTIESKSE